MATRSELFRWIGYPAWFFFCLICFGYCTFPYDRVKEIVRVKLEEGMGADVQIAELSPSWVTGVEVEGIEIKTRPTRSTDTPTAFHIDSLTARVGVLSLLTGGVDLSYAVEIYGGEIEGTYEDDGDGSSMTVQFASLDLGQVQTIRGAVGLPIAGTLSGEANLILPEKLLSKAEGAVKLVGSGIRVGDGRAKVPIPPMREGLTIDPIEVGDLHGELLVKAGKATITRLGASGKDLELIGEGRVDLRDPAPMSTVNAYIRFKINPAYTKRHDRMAPLVGGLDLMPETKRAKRPDGFFGYRVSGTLQRGLSFAPSARQPLARERPERGARPVGPRSPRIPAARGRDAAEVPIDPALDPAIMGPPVGELPDEQNLIAP